MRSVAVAIAAALVIAAAGCGDNAASAGPDDLEVTPATAALEIGASTQLAASLLRRGVEFPDDSITWSSSDPARATVAGSGTIATVTAVAVGTVAITATGRGLSATSQVTITPAGLVGIAIAPTAPAVPAGTTAAITVTATYRDHTTADVTADVTWSSAQPAIARAAGKVLTGAAKGTTTVTATYRDKSATAPVSVIDPLLRSIDVTAAAAFVVLGGTLAFTATGHYSDGSVRDLTTAVTWVSSMTTVATISNAAGMAGVMSSVATGMTTISANRGPVTGTTTLTVEPSALVSIAVTPGAPSIAVTTDQQFTAMGTFSDHTTLDVTAAVTWTSSATGVATIAQGGLASAVAVGSTTITAKRDTTSGPISGSTTASVVLPAVGAWVAVAGFTGTPCRDGVKFSMASDMLYVCTTAGGMIRGAVAADTSITLTTLDVTGNLAGLSVAAHPQAPTAMMYTTVPSGANANWFRSSNSGTAFTPATLLDSANNPRYLYAGRFQPSVGNMLGSWDPGTGGAPQAIVLTGMNPPLTARVLAATGSVRGFAGSAAANLYAVVLGETPSGAAATGGVFRSINSAATWTETDAGIAAADRDQLTALAIDPVTPATLYAGARGGARIYKTTDAGATWAASAQGIPASARVTVLYVSAQDPMKLFAGTDRGLYRSVDGGATWTLAGFLGRAIQGVAQSGAAASLIVVGVDDPVGLYRAQ